MKYIKSFSDTSALQDYLDTSAGFGTFVFEDRSKEYEDSIVYVRRESKDYLTFTAEQANSTVKYNATTNTTAEYSLDGGDTWTDAVGVTVTLANVGDKVKYRGTINGNISTSSSRFTMSGKVAASGSVMSMYNNNPNDVVISYEGAFRGMFNSSIRLTTAPELPATTLANNCYQDMFEGCSSLTSAPELPATTLAPNCYSSMFAHCYFITTAPELPAMTLASGCYQNMFNGSGLTVAPELPATTLVNACYWHMFEGCGSLTSVPELSATTLVTNCYNNMFNGCSSLTSVTHHIVSWSTTNAKDWLKNVSSYGIVYCPSNSTIPADDVSGIPTNWARVNI